MQADINSNQGRRDGVSIICPPHLPKILLPPRNFFPRLFGCPPSITYKGPNLFEEDRPKSTNDAM